MSTLIAIGGALALHGPAMILREFYQRSGGSAADIVIVTTASSRADAGEEYLPALQNLGLQHSLKILRISQKNETRLSEHLEALQNATGIFFAGGNQLRLSAILGGTPVEDELHNAFKRGAVIAGTSAGASALSTMMFAYGKTGPTPRSGIAQLAPGLGFTDQVIFDQHFRQRDRLGRLLYAIANHPRLLGVGVDENTAALLENHLDGKSQITVIGKNAVTIVDGSQIVSSDVAELTVHRPVAISNIHLHILTHGCTFDLNTHQVHIPEKRLDLNS